MGPADTDVDHHVSTEVRDEPVDVTVEIIAAVEPDSDEHVSDAHDAIEPDPLRGLVRREVLRDVLSRQLEVGHDLGSELVDAATNVSVAMAHAPAAVVGEIRGGATLPAALVQSGTTVREAVGCAGSNLRTAVGDYVGHQATLPNAVLVGASDVAESVLRAQGRVAASTINATFTLATAVVHGGDLRGMASRERRVISSTTDVAREAVGESWGRARGEIRGAVAGFDEVAAEFAEAGPAR